MKSKAIF